MPLAYGEQRAISEIESVMNAQWKNGMLPHIRFVKGQTGYSPDEGEWGVTGKVSGNAAVQTSGITQPPNIGYALWKVFERSQNMAEIAPLVESIYPGLRKFHDFLLKERDPNSEGLACVFHPWATGSDNTPCYDQAVKAAGDWLREKGFEQRIKKRKDHVYVAAGQRPKQKDYETYGRLLGFFLEKEYEQDALFNESPFLVQDVLFNAILAASLQATASLSEALAGFSRGKPEREQYYRKEAVRNRMLASKVRKAIREKLFDKGTGLFYSYDLRAEEPITIPTVHSLVPMFGKCATEEQAEELKRHLLSEEEFNPGNGFMVPSVPLDSKNFDGIGYARGPIWPVRNWLVCRGLENYDRGLAEKLGKQTMALVSQGFSDRQKMRELAASLMMFNSFGESFTVPSRKQYSHGWLWDSGFAALGWSRVKERPSTLIWERVEERTKELLEEGKGMQDAKHAVRREFKMPLFDEYFTPVPCNGMEAGSPLGSDLMTWTAALFLDLASQ